jgi:tetratricopeptide (TPR) repeat protein
MKIRELGSDKHFKTAVVVFLAGLTVATSLIIILNNRALGLATEAGRDARILGLRSLTHLSSSLWDVAAETKLKVSWLELGELAKQAGAYEDMSRGAEASLYRISRERLIKVRDLLADRGVITKPPYFNAQAGIFDSLQYYLDHVSVPATELFERQDQRKREGGFWGSKSDAYGTALAVMAVAVFLLTLSLVLSGRVRFIISGAGLALALAVGVAAAATALRTWRGVSEESIRALARSSADVTRARLAMDNLGDAAGATVLAARARQSLQTILERDPGYTTAELLRSWTEETGGEALFFAGRIEEGRTALGRAAQGFREVIRSGRDDGFIRWSLGFVELMLGRPEEALRSLDQALAALPDQGFSLGAVRAVALLAAGRSAEATAALEKAIALAGERPLATDAVAFRTMVKNLERWDEAAPAPGLAAMIKRLKEAAVCIAYLHRTQPLPSRSDIGTPRFVNPVYDKRGEIVDVPACDTYPRFTASAPFLLDLKGMVKDQSIVSKVLWKGPGRIFWMEQQRLGKVRYWNKGDGRQLLGEVAPPFPEAGEFLLSGNYRLEIYVDGALKAVVGFKTL